MFGKIIFAIGLASAGLLLLILNLTTPSTAGAWGILVVFLLGYVVALTVVTFGLWGAARIIAKAGSETKPARAVARLSLTKAYYYATVIALAPVILVSLQSVGGVGIYETGLVILFVALGCLYVSRRLK